MASAATVDAPLAEPRPPSLGEDTTGRPTRRNRSRKRKSGEDENSEGQGKKRTFDNFFNFCSFVLAYEEQLERQATATLAGERQATATLAGEQQATATSTPSPPPSTITTNTNGHTLTQDTHPPTPPHQPTNGILNSNANTNGQTHAPPHPHTITTSTSSTSSTSDSSDSGEEERERAGSVPTSTDEKLEYTSEDESWNLVTCFCRRPFAGRPMIECSKCNTWVHLFCAKIRKSAVPDVYTCPRCAPKTSPSTTTTRRSTSTAS